ncbi:NAD(P)/FAD-dependent oxidoreductase [Streptomyces sp. ME19-01-6]|uniref:NAD(P)/FAD-dependent oxidoreductase n=1 Tax=Streptomyces sp. ME19-01-6 TaxID=3028686 RepID=UPI0029AD55C3|nr:NAD(P)/FAD-dependent oxidoreductase [Streptomyces sp. ME19-01-6]MDX3229567.1 NAD(P)/FAD-dependent oxidoreductase [Streptomyces sp. ME19-01-6]
MTDKERQEATAVTTPLYASDALDEGTVDAVVIGGGAAGLNGALILARSRRSVVVIDSGSPRNAPAEAVHGLLALDGTPPSEILRRGREQVRQYGGRVVFGEVVAAEPAAPSADGDLRFTVTLADGRHVTARRVLVATGLKDVLPEVPGLAGHWGHSVVHCPYCHGWEVRDEPIGILATGPASIGHALLFRQLTEDLAYFTHGTDLDEDSRARFAARGIRVIDTPVTEVVNDEDGALAGVRLADGQVVARRVLAVGPNMQARTQGLEGLGLPVQDLPTGRGFASGPAGTTEVPGVWVAGNATDPVAQVGASAAAGALAGADINKTLAIADTDAALQTINEASPTAATR